VADYDGRPLLQHALDAANAAPGLDRVVLVLGHEADRVREAVDLGRAEVVVAEDWDEGQAASLRAGVIAAADADAVVVILGDQPGLRPGAIARVLAARGDADAVRPVHAGKPSHPVVLEQDLFAALLRLRGDVGARDALRERRVIEVDMDAALADVDTVDDLR
jgi:molybdenum cofactor cytidylyltransferase